VSHADTANLDSGQVHPVYATFALGRDAEWCCRLFVLEMKEEDEEGIGTFLSIEHRSPALENSQVVFTATS
jgi:predicted thioesterase